MNSRVPRSKTRHEHLSWLGPGGQSILPQLKRNPRTPGSSSRLSGQASPAPHGPLSCLMTQCCRWQHTLTWAPDSSVYTRTKPPSQSALQCQRLANLTAALAYAARRPPPAGAGRPAATAARGRWPGQRVATTAPRPIGSPGINYIRRSLAGDQHKRAPTTHPLRVC